MQFSKKISIKITFKAALGALLILISGIFSRSTQGEAFTLRSQNSNQSRIIFFGKSGQQSVFINYYLQLINFEFSKFSGCFGTFLNDFVRFGEWGTVRLLPQT